MANDLKAVTGANRKAWDAPARHHLESEAWQSLLRGFAQPGYSVFDTTITQLLSSIPIDGKSVVQVGCNNGREILSAVSLGAQRGLVLINPLSF